MSIKDTVAPARPGAEKIVIERTYRADVEEVWDLWTTKEGFESWWGPGGFRVEVHTMEARPGGSIHYDMIAAGPDEIRAMQQIGRPLSHAAHARFSELRPRVRLAITHTVDFLPGVQPYDSTMAVDLVPDGNYVRMVVTLDPMHDDEFTRMSTMGFTSQLEKLDARFARPSV